MRGMVAAVTMLALVIACGSGTAESQGRRAGRPFAQAAPPVLPADVRVLRGIAYGSDPAQRFDVYAREGLRDAPTVLLVHGGGWRRGDKAAGNVLAAKLARWTERGIVVISTDYRMLPAADPLTQSRDVGRAVAAAQRDSARWGGNPDRFVLVGHSAGAHLVALLTADPATLAAIGARAVLGAVLLDGAMLDAEAFMAAPHLPLFDQAFGADPNYWRDASPIRHLTANGAPLLAVCSTRRVKACAQAETFVARARALGRQAQVLGEDLSHRQINSTLGERSAYTESVEAFLRGLDPALARALIAP